jgi:hypothetical protein
VVTDSDFMCGRPLRIKLLLEVFCRGIDIAVARAEAGNDPEQTHENVECARAKAYAHQSLEKNVTASLAPEGTSCVNLCLRRP